LKSLLIQITLGNLLPVCPGKNLGRYCYRVIFTPRRSWEYFPEHEADACVPHINFKRNIAILLVKEILEESLESANTVIT